MYWYERIIVVGVISVALALFAQTQVANLLPETDPDRMEAGQIIPDVIDAIGKAEFEVGSSHILMSMFSQ